MPEGKYFMCDFKTLNISRRRPCLIKPELLKCFTFYRLFDVDVMKFLKVRGSTVSHKHYRSSVKQMACGWTLKLIIRT